MWNLPSKGGVSMSNKYCTICHKGLAENYEPLVCANERCQLINEARTGLSSQINQFKDFWNGKVPNQENYREYLILIGKEDSYQEYILDMQQRGFEAPTRRVYFQLNHASVHVGWPDEFGRPFIDYMQQE